MLPFIFFDGFLFDSKFEGASGHVTAPLPEFKGEYLGSITRENLRKNSVVVLQSTQARMPVPQVSPYRAVRRFSFSSVSTSAVNSAFACRCRSPVAELGKPACTLRTNPSRPSTNVVGQAFQFTACVSLSFPSLCSPPSTTVYSIPYFLIQARSLA